MEALCRSVSDLSQEPVFKGIYKKSDLKAMDREKPAEIAHRTGLTERRIRQIIKEIREENSEKTNMITDTWTDK